MNQCSKYLNVQNMFANFDLADSFIYHLAAPVQQTIECFKQGEQVVCIKGGVGVVLLFW